MVKKGNITIILGGIVGVTLIYLGLFTFGGLDSTLFEGITGFSLIDINSPRLFCTDTTCIWQWRSNFPVTSSLGLKEKIDLSVININEPIIVQWRIDLRNVEPECEQFLASLGMSIEINDGFDKDFITIGGETLSTDIQPFIDTNVGELEIRFGTTQICPPLDEMKLLFTISSGDNVRPSAPTITFTKFGSERSMDEVIEDMMGQPVLIQCFDCDGDVSMLVENANMCPALNCTTPPITPTPMSEEEMEEMMEEENGGLPELTIETGLATQIFVVLGVIIVAVVGIAIFVRRKTAPITEF